MLSPKVAHSLTTVALRGWLGSRHSATAEVAKVYLELPAGLPAAEAARHPILVQPQLRRRMAGLNPDGTYEVYARGDDLGRPLVDRLEEMAFGSSGVLSAAVATFLRGPELLSRAGISVLLAPSGQAMALTWFASALGNFRDDAAAAPAISALAAGSCPSGSLEIYRALAAGPPDGRWRHTVVGVGLSADGRSWLQTGLRPT